MDTFVKEFVENETDTQVLKTINNAIIPKLLTLTNKDITKQYIDNKKQVDDLKKKQNQMTKNIRQYDKNLEEHISKNHEASLVTSEKDKLTAAIKTLDQLNNALSKAEKDLSDIEHTKDNYITSPQIVQQLNKIYIQISNKIKNEENLIQQKNMDEKTLLEGKQNDESKEKLLATIRELKDHPAELDIFIMKNQIIIDGIKFSNTELLELINIFNTLLINKTVKINETIYTIKSIENGKYKINEKAYTLSDLITILSLKSDNFLVTTLLNFVNKFRYKITSRGINR